MPSEKRKSQLLLTATLSSTSSHPTPSTETSFLPNPGREEGTESAAVPPLLPHHRRHQSTHPRAYLRALSRCTCCCRVTLHHFSRGVLQLQTVPPTACLSADFKTNSCISADRHRRKTSNRRFWRKATLFPHTFSVATTPVHCAFFLDNKIARAQLPGKLKLWRFLKAFCVKYRCFALVCPPHSPAHQQAFDYMGKSH